VADEPLEIAIGRRDSDHVLIQVVGPMYPEADAFWDGNWLTSPITARLPGFTVDLDAALRTDELQSFRQELERFHRTMSGRAELVSLEEWITLQVVREPNGHLDVGGKLSEDSPARNTLRFSLPGLDQTDLPGLIDALLAVEGRFPVVGERPGPWGWRDALAVRSARANPARWASYAAWAWTAVRPGWPGTAAADVRPPWRRGIPGRCGRRRRWNAGVKTSSSSISMP